MSDNNSFTSHFTELRSRLIKTIVFILIIFVISYTFAKVYEITNIIKINTIVLISLERSSVK